jgi:AbrB family looped-hinge helix DNA binding protein
MITSTVDEQFRIMIPKEARQSVKVGEEYIVLPDKNGRLILIPVSQVDKILARTAGLWQGRDDIPTDGVEYVNQIRSGNRLADLGISTNGS